MNRFRLLAVLAVVVVAGLAAGTLASRLVEKGDGARAPAGAVKVFTLTDHRGQTVTDETFRSRWLLVFFGFTHCPDVCPASMIFASDLLQSLGDGAKNLQVVFISIDPARDTPVVLSDYLTNFDPRIVGLTGTADQVAAAARDYGVYFARRAMDGVDDYTMDHSTAFYLVNPAGALLRAYSIQNGGDDLTKDILAAISTAP